MKGKRRKNINTIEEKLTSHKDFKKVIKSWSKLLGLILIISFLTGCYNNRVWKSNDFVNWYGKYWHDRKHSYRPLYYRGTGANNHHFMMRTIDSYLLIKIDKHELNMPEEKLYKSGSSAKFPGYYIVDPMNNFKRIHRKNKIKQ